MIKTIPYKNVRVAFVALLICLISATLPVLSLAEDGAAAAVNTNAETFKRDITLPKEKKGNILNIVLSKAPAISTERGTLIIDAYHDENMNSLWDEKEARLTDEIVCTIDEVSYTIPAYIPALDYNARYKISCQGTGLFQPTLNQKNVLIAQRGQIINMAIPCLPQEP